MKTLAKLAVVIAAFSVVSASGQSRAEIEAKYGQPAKAYTVSQKIWMSPDYASDGQVCRMTLYPRRFSSTTNYLINELPFDEFRSVIDAIVPVATRGAQKEPFGNGNWNAGGGGRWADFVYERLTITYIAGLPTVNTDFRRGEPVSLDLSEAEVSKAKDKPKAARQDLSHLYSDSTAEIVTIQWNDRKCLGRP